ncbi:transposase [Psychrobacter sp. DAB_AL43B]|uniref:transposase n=1 Tax=Psychrobacter sp. DAB_AL43B TaxID=1028416 RepID=UPI0009A6ECCF|nr:transposase [Psychrobacter sp. DAB_AL43B]SLJ84315.1 transposase, OrfA [Psychrobacter sp. DAB_AL43B]
MTNKRNQYTREFKLEAISLVTDHKRKIPDVADSLGIGKSTLQKWLSQYRQEMSSQAPKVGNALTDEQRELQELRKQVKRLTMERDILNEEG